MNRKFSENNLGNGRFIPWDEPRHVVASGPMAQNGFSRHDFHKLHLIFGWTHFNNWYIEWKWAGDPFRSRMLFKFSPDDNWIQADSFEEDLLPTYKFGKEQKAK